MSFKFLNIPVHIQPTFWLLLVFFCFDPNLHPLKMVILGSVLFFSLLFHEYGHALAAKRIGRDPEITLEGLGGYASYDGRGLDEKYHFIITLCGPVFTALLIAISFSLLQSRVATNIYFYYFLLYTMKLNIYWLIVNLAPLNPLDGGKIMEYLFKKWIGIESGHKFSLILGNITAVVASIYFLFQGSYMFAYIFLFYGFKNYQAYNFEYIRRRPNHFALYNQALAALENNENEKAQSILEKLAKSKDEYIKILSQQRLAHLFEQEGNVNDAYRILSKIDPERLNTGKCLLCKLAYTQKNYKLIEKHSREIYDLSPTFDIAVLNAKAFAQLKNFEYSIGWLKTALQFPEGNTSVASDILTDQAFNSMRHLPEFQDLMTTTSASRS